MSRHIYIHRGRARDADPKALGWINVGVYKGATVYLVKAGVYAVSSAEGKTFPSAEAAMKFLDGNSA